MTSPAVASVAIEATRLVYDAGTGSLKPARSRSRFIRGPIPYGWLKTAFLLPGKAGQVAISIWFVVGLRGSLTVRVTGEAVELAGCSRQAYNRGLVSLELAGLIAVLRHPGHDLS